MLEVRCLLWVRSLGSSQEGYLLGALRSSQKIAERSSRAGQHDCV
jgi:hypothetical protein